MEKIESLLQQEIALVIQNEIKDPRLSGMVSVTKVEVAQDMHNATVFVSVFSLDNVDEHRAKDLEVLNHSARYIMFLLSKKLEIKYIPELVFKLDLSIEQASRVLGIINRNKQKT
jgi:ribosome-binding factor A